MTIARKSPRGSREIASRITQKLIAILESRTREGYAYKLDLRLRPSGNAGPLVTSLAGFREYHRQSSAVWERQALVRARVITGDRELGREVEAARQEFVYGRGLTAAEVAEIAAMRHRMEMEIGAEDKTRLNIKQGHGGLVDVEFLAQMMALAHGHRHPELRVRDTIGLARGARRAATADGRRRGRSRRRLPIFVAAGKSAPHRERPARLGDPDLGDRVCGRWRAGWDSKARTAPRECSPSCPSAAIESAQSSSDISRAAQTSANLMLRVHFVILSDRQTNPGCDTCLRTVTGIPSLRSE